MGKGKYLKKVKASLGKKIFRVVLIVVLVLVLLLGAVAAFVWSKLGKITYDDGSIKETVSTVDPTTYEADPTDAVDATDGSAEEPAVEETTPEETEAVQSLDMTGLNMTDAPAYSSGELFKDEDVMNILVVGTDERTEGFVQNCRGDLNILISINKAEGTVKLVSFSRGIAIKMLDGPYAGQYEWLTNAHRWASKEAILQAMEDAFKIECDRYVRVNFNTVRKVVDAIGGIEIEMTQAEADEMNAHRRQEFFEGVNHLHGGYALDYARLRAVDDDWGRIARQRKVILAAVEKLKGSSFSTLNDLCDMVLPLIQTNLTKLEIAELILYSPKFLQSEFDQLTIPIANSYGGMTVMSGVGGWALDYEKNNAALHEFLFGADAE